ncbi:MAG: hypothetical protein K8H88_14200 [Sandaracinaceae bacterium]|nr:hypothetical protein [Sandaracinaceae bacterium]
MNSTILSYDFDELIRRLRDQGCTVTRRGLETRRTGRVAEFLEVRHGTRSTSLQVLDDDSPLARSVVRSIVERLGLPLAPFEL